MPKYKAGHNKLEVYLNGVRCIEGADSVKASFSETGDPGSDSTHIIWHQDIDTSYNITVIAHQSGHSSSSEGGSTESGLAGGTIIGKIDLLPFRANELPVGWYFCNGDSYTLTSLQGAALNALPTNFKTDWGITSSGENISLPNLFHTDGRGFYLRSADGYSKQVGSTEEDAIQKFTGTFGSSIQASSGVFSSTSPYGWQLITSPVYSYFYTTTLNLANQVRVDDTETRVLSRYMTPAIFLGV